MSKTKEQLEADIEALEFDLEQKDIELARLRAAHFTLEERTNTPEYCVTELKRQGFEVFHKDRIDEVTMEGGRKRRTFTKAARYDLVLARRFPPQPPETD